MTTSMGSRHLATGAIPLMSPPAQKALPPAPFISTKAVCGSFSQCCAFIQHVSTRAVVRRKLVVLVAWERAERYRVVRPEEVDHVQVEGVERFGPVEDHLLSLAQRLYQHLGLQEAICINCNLAILLHKMQASSIMHEAALPQRIRNSIFSANGTSWLQSKLWCCQRS